MFAESMEKLYCNGKTEGKTEERRDILINLLSLRFGLAADEKEVILGTTSRQKIEQAIESFVFAENKETVLDTLLK